MDQKERLKLIREYKVKHKINTNTLARVLGCAPSSIRRWYIGHTIPAWTEKFINVLKLHSATKQKQIIKDAK